MLISTAIVAIGIVTLRTAVTFWPQPPLKFDSSLKLNIESRLSLGIPIAISRCEVPDLELIPSVGPALALKLFKNRELLIQRASALPQPSQALITIKGIGPTKAALLSPWLELH